MSEVRSNWRHRRRPQQQHEQRQQRPRRRHADAGMTLPELLISILVTGTLVTGMAVATTVVLRQGDNNKGRLNNSRSEQSVGLWMPADLASAEYVDTNAASTPCGTACPADVNVEYTHRAKRVRTRAVVKEDVHDSIIREQTGRDRTPQVAP